MSTLDGWPDAGYGLLSADGWNDMGSHAGSANCCVKRGSCNEATIDAGGCGGDWRLAVRERLFDFFNGTHYDDVNFTHPVCTPQRHIGMQHDGTGQAQGRHRALTRRVACGASCAIDAPFGRVSPCARLRR